MGTSFFQERGQRLFQGIDEIACGLLSGRVLTIADGLLDSIDDVIARSETHAGKGAGNVDPVDGENVRFLRGGL